MNHNELLKYDIHPQKRFGQNFLVDENITAKIIETADILPTDCVIEIGPGQGVLTKHLCKLAKKVVAIEIDKKLSEILAEELKDCDNFNLITGDFLKIPFEDILDAAKGDGSYVKVVANLPYYITTPILMRVLEHGANIYSITVMMQKEVAGRITAMPGTKEYGAISLALNYYAMPEIAFCVSPNCFFPRPKVDSVVMRLTAHKTPPVTVRDKEKMFKLIRAAFDQRRKTLCNAVANFAALNISKKDIKAALYKLGHSPTIRGERLSLEEFARLSDCIGG